MLAVAVGLQSVASVKVILCCLTKTLCLNVHTAKGRTRIFLCGYPSDKTATFEPNYFKLDGSFYEQFATAIEKKR